MTKSPDTRRALGKGLSALLPSRTTTVAAPPAATAPDGPAFSQIPITSIDPNPHQPRADFQADRLGDLAESIREHGVIQPILVRRKADRYELVAGERRWRAARLAGIAVIPAVIQDALDDKLLELALVENIQREDLNAIEVARAFDRMATSLNLTHEQISQRTGKDRTTITNFVRLLKLPGDVQIMLAERKLSMGHARAILGLPTPELQVQVAETAAGSNLSVRQVERMVQRLTTSREPKTTEEVKQDPNVRWAAQELESALGTKVRIIEKTDQRGRIEIEYYSQEELDRLYTLLTGGNKTLSDN